MKDILKALDRVIETIDRKIEENNYLKDKGDISTVKIQTYKGLVTATGVFTSIHDCNAHLESEKGKNDGVVLVVDGCIFTADKNDLGEKTK